MMIVNDTVFRYKIKTAQAEGRSETLYLLAFVFEKRNYGFALPDESPHIESVKSSAVVCPRYP